MPHIHQEPGQYDHTASAYIIRTDFDEPKLMLHKHKIFGKWMQPGGHIELSENPWAAIQHEILEETGYDMTQLQVLQPKERLKELTVATLHPQPLAYISHPFKDLGHFHTDISFAFVTNQKPAHPVAKGESPDFTYINREELATVDTLEGVREIGAFLFDSVLNVWEPVPANRFTT